jgi:hypothetical protein
MRGLFRRPPMLGAGSPALAQETSCTQLPRGDARGRVPYPRAKRKHCASLSAMWRSAASSFSPETYASLIVLPRLTSRQHETSSPGGGADEPPPP